MPPVLCFRAQQVGQSKVFTYDEKLTGDYASFSGAGSKDEKLKLLFLDYSDVQPTFLTCLHAWSGFGFARFFFFLRAGLTL